MLNTLLCHCSVGEAEGHWRPEVKTLQDIVRLQVQAFVNKLKGLNHVFTFLFLCVVVSSW